MDGYSRIISHYHELPFGRHYITHEWEGKPNQPAFISYFSWTEIKDYPWPLTKIGDRPEEGGALYARKDGWLWANSYWMRGRLWIRKRLELVYYRLIMTAMVWGLAYVDPGSIPSWRDIGKRSISGKIVGGK
jgi:hypothetical protein